MYERRHVVDEDIQSINQYFLIIPHSWGLRYRNILCERMLFIIAYDTQFIYTKMWKKYEFEIKLYAPKKKLEAD